jgi:ribose transport system substrate-binding protein
MSLGNELVIVRSHGAISNMRSPRTDKEKLLWLRCPQPRLGRIMSLVAKTPRFVLSLLTQDNDYQVEQAASAEEAARRLGVGVQVIYADNDAIQQSQQVLQFIQCDPAQRPDAIILEPVGATALPQVARAAVDAAIAWVVLNRHVNYLTELRRLPTAMVLALAADNQEVGRIQGRQFATMLSRGGNILYIQGPSDSETAKLRAAGMSETKPANVQLKIVRGQWTEASAFKAITSWLQLTTSQRAQVDIVAAQNDAMAVGAKRQSAKLRIPISATTGANCRSWASMGSQKPDRHGSGPDF